MTVSSVSVNGVPARFSFVQPTYPGDPNGQNDRRPQRRGRHHRGLVPRLRWRLRDHRAGGLRRLDAAQRLPGGQAQLRLLRHGHRGPSPRAAARPRPRAGPPSRPAW
jgi:hypothetical protein